MESGSTATVPTISAVLDSGVKRALVRSDIFPSPLSQQLKWLSPRRYIRKTGGMIVEERDDPPLIIASGSIVLVLALLSNISILLRLLDVHCVSLLLPESPIAVRALLMFPPLTAALHRYDSRIPGRSHNFISSHLRNLRSRARQSRWLHLVDGLLAHSGSSHYRRCCRCVFDRRWISDKMVSSWWNRTVWRAEIIGHCFRFVHRQRGDRFRGISVSFETISHSRLSLTFFSLHYRLSLSSPLYPLVHQPSHISSLSEVIDTL